MTREQLLARVELDRAAAQRQGWLAALIGVVLIVGAAWWTHADGPSSGATLSFTAGGAGVLMALARQLTPKPSHGGGRLEARKTLIGWAMSAALLAVVATAILYAVTMQNTFRRVELLVALAFVIALMLMTWGLSLGGGPVVVIDGEGYFDRRAMRAPIPWDQLEPISTQWVGRQVYYRVQAKDRSRLTWLARANTLVGFDGFAMNGVGLDHGEGDMLLAIHAYRPGLIGDI